MAYPQIMSVGGLNVSVSRFSVIELNPLDIAFNLIGSSIHNSCSKLSALVKLCGAEKYNLMFIYKKFLYAVL